MRRGEPSLGHVKTYWMYAAILIVSSVIALNPITYSFVATEDWWPRRLGQLYLALIDVYLIVMAVSAAIYALRSGKLARIVALSSLSMFVPLFIGVEISLNYYKFIVALEEERSARPLSILHRADELAGYVLIENAEYDQKLPDGKLVTYVIDGQGCRKIESNSEVKSRLLFFGDSFLFGPFVENHETALQLLAERLKENFLVLNCAVNGYGLVQMYANLVGKSEMLTKHDTVVFAPYSNDIERNLISRRLPCAHFFKSLSAYYKYFPVFRSGRLQSVRLENECDFLRDYLILRSPLPVGHLYRWLHELRHGPRYLRNADLILNDAKTTVRGRGAEFVVIFIASPAECNLGRHVRDLSDLKTNVHSIIDLCPSNREEAERLQLPYDYHWSKAGHRWAAEALETRLRSLGVLEPSPD